ncbi:MAG: DUF3575 domain-containing protein [Bacteroidia bacterium]
MLRYFIFSLIILPTVIFAQQKTYIKLNTAALVMGTLELDVEKHLSDISALEFGIGVRKQRLDSGQTAGFQSLARFRGEQNFNLSGMVGIRFFENNPYEHPFIAFRLTGAYYNEDVRLASEELQNFSGFRIGATLVLGVSFPLGDRMGLDAGIQAGYASPRKLPEPGNYYFPYMGYAVSDFNIVSVPGGHFQPVFAFRYKIQESRRDRIRR